jgi:CubicO group peptidase (beta-lactamase class C family)
MSRKHRLERRFAFATLFVAFALATVSGARGRAVPTPVRAASSDLASVDELVAKAMAEWKVPGLAVGVVKDGKVVIARGYGYRDVARKLPVTADTLMAIGSNSKSFTTTLMGMLSDAGKLDWNAPVRNYLPDFQLQDDVATRLMTPTDLVTHRSGLPRHDALWFGRSFTRADLYSRLRFLEPSATFRQRYQYNNLMFMTAGVLLERVTAKAWDDLVRERLFQPLGMTRSNTSVRDLPASDDASLPYVVVKGEPAPVPYRNIDAVAPAGAINSSVREMLTYIQMHLELGTHGGKPIISKAFALRMQSPHSAPAVNTDPDAPRYPELGPGGYGLGVNVDSYRGHTIVAHGGGIDGFISSMSWMPSDRVGVVVLSNLSGINPVPTIVMRRVYDEVLGLPPVDWMGRQKEQQARAEARQKETAAREQAERVTGTSPSHALPDYAGTYEHRAYGTVRIGLEKDVLTLTVDGFILPLRHHHYDIFVAQPAATPGPLANMRVTFTYGSNGRINALSMPLEPAVSPIVFARQAASKSP